jgi:hypothetical protein
MGVEEFRVGGTSGGWKMLFGKFAELGEDMLSMESPGVRRVRSHRAAPPRDVVTR